MIPSGAINKLVTLLAQSTVRDGSGALVPDPGGGQVFAACWAKIAPMSGAELYRSQQFVSEATVQVVIRWRKGVLTNMVVRYAGGDGVRNFIVLAVLNDGEQNVQLTLLCKEINDQ